MATYQTLSLQHSSGGTGNRLKPLSGASKSKRARLRDFAALCRAFASGALGKGGTVIVGNTPATGTVTLSSASGTVSAVVNGVTVSVTASGGDTATATALASAINASVNALVAQHVTASSALGVVTLTADSAGPAGNAVTLAGTGTGVTASGARLTGGDFTAYTF